MGHLARMFLLGIACFGPSFLYGEEAVDISTAALPEVEADADEFYASVINIQGPNVLLVTVLDVWNPMDKIHGARWPDGCPKVKPVQREIVLEDITIPANTESRDAAMNFLEKAIKESDNEIICSGSRVDIRKETNGETIVVTGYVYVKEGFTLNNALVREGLATTENPFYKSWQAEAERKNIGIWREKDNGPPTHEAMDTSGASKSSPPHCE